MTQPDHFAKCNVCSFQSIEMRFTRGGVLRLNRESLYSSEKAACLLIGLVFEVLPCTERKG